MKLKELASLLNCPYEGNGEVEIKRVASLEEAREGDLSFLSHPRYKNWLEKTKATAIILNLNLQVMGKNIIRSANPQLTFIQAAEILSPEVKPTPVISPAAWIAASAQIGPEVSVGPGCVIGERVKIGARTVIHPLVVIYSDVEIGEDCLIHSHVAIREKTIIGNRVIIHNGVVIGSDGFGYVQLEKGEHRKIPQLGRVIIEDEVEIGANTAIDRATLGETRIGRGTKIDNLVQIAHNVKIGANSILAGQVGIAGSTRIGQRVVMGGQVGIADHVDIGDGVLIAAKSGVMRDLPPGAFVAGIPSLDIKEWRKICVLLPRLAETFKEIKELKERIEELEKKISNKDKK
ncbi:MAG: UDP-3-O-(3-hydroxymyristoyl)glucosamine N-acyltransferase [Candidatus Aminicenantes bacterium]|nr:UDP-3-O-(3-hydroxymyristoyl)glucosamine N-acyltransferase [Candidatus Aminicenantes bacterium]